jgi:hypothetical protein
MRTLHRLVLIGSLTLLSLQTVACSGSDSSAPAAPATEGDSQNATAAAGLAKLAGTWKLDSSTDTDGIGEWIDQAELKADGTFTASFGGNVCDDSGNCEAGTRSASGTAKLTTASGKDEIGFAYKAQTSNGGTSSFNDKFVYSLSGTKLTMNLASDTRKTGTFVLDKK